MSYLEENKRKVYIILLLIGLALSLYAGYCQSSRAYMLAKTYYSHGQIYVSDEIYYVDTARRYLENIFKLNINYFKMSGSTDSNYYNLEHPPLGKYIIALSMVACGDKPLCWRLPGIIEAFMIPLIVFFTVARPSRKTSNRSVWPIIAGIIAAIAAGSDRIIFMDASVAMLDIHLAFFVSLTLLALSYRRMTLATIFAGLAFMVKMTGLAAIGVLFTYYIILFIKNRNINIFIKNISKIILIIFIISIIIYIPLIYYFGPKEIVTATLDALKWHTTSRPPGPPVSGPTGWLVNLNPFYFSYNMVLAGGITTPLIEVSGFIAAAILTALSLALAFSRKVIITPGSWLVINVLFLFMIIYVLGNHTFYSFYAIVWAPGISSALGETILTMVGLAKDN